MRNWNDCIQILVNIYPVFEITVGHWPFSDHFQGFGQSKSNLLGQIYYTFSVGKSMIVHKNVPTFNEWPTNFWSLFQALYIFLKRLNFSFSYWSLLPVHTAQDDGDDEWTCRHWYRLYVAGAMVTMAVMEGRHSNLISGSWTMSVYLLNILMDIICRRWVGGAQYRLCNQFVYTMV